MPAMTPNKLVRHVLHRTTLKINKFSPLLPFKIRNSCKIGKGKISNSCIINTVFVSLANHKSHISKVRIIIFTKLRNAKKIHISNITKFEILNTLKFHISKVRIVIFTTFLEIRNFFTFVIFGKVHIVTFLIT